MNQPIYFDDVAVGDAIPPREHGPLTIVDTVRWAGLQENWQHLHFDRDHVRQHNGLKTFIASGAYRQALLTRMLTDWIGPRGWLRKISIRHTYSTFEGDKMRFGARIAEKSDHESEPWIVCDIEGNNQEGKQILTGRCTLLLPRRETK
jgi:acyl dehydratase